MELPAARARDRRRVSAAVPLVSLAWRAERGSQTPVVADRRRWRAAGRGRLVDGGIGAFRARRSFALLASHPSDAGAPDFLGHRLDAAANGAGFSIGCIGAAQDHRCGAAGADIRAALSWRTARRAARRTHLQYLA